MKKILFTSLLCLAIFIPSVAFAQDGGKKNEDTKKEKTDDCKDDSCKKPEK